MRVDKDVLTSEVCHAMLTKLAFLAGSGQKSALVSVGVSDREIARLKSLSVSDLNRLIDGRKTPVNIQTWVRSLLEGLQEDVPEEYLPFLECGANNKMMVHFFKVSADQCRAWKETVTVEKIFRARTIPHKKHSGVCKALLKHGDYRQLTADALLEVAQTHQVSLSALWNEIKKWEKESEQENKA